MMAMLAFATGVSAKDNDRITQTRKVADFTRIEVTTVGQIYFTQSGDHCRSNLFHAITRSVVPHRGQREACEKHHYRGA